MNVSQLNDSAKIFWLNTDDLLAETCYRNYYHSVSRARRQKIDGYHFQKDRLLSLGTGILLDRGLSLYGLRESAVRIAAEPEGKPYLVDFPHIHFNLSHSEKRVMAVFAPVPVGCDVELIKEADLAIARDFFCKNEYDYIVGQPDVVQTNRAFYRLWTLKESFLKAIGLGLSLSLDSFELCLPSGREPTVIQTRYPGCFRFREYEKDGYRSAVCFYYLSDKGVSQV